MEGGSGDVRLLDATKKKDGLLRILAPQLLKYIFYNKNNDLKWKFTNIIETLNAKSRQELLR